MVQYDDAGYVAETTTGPRCGCCAGRVRHANADSVRACYDITRGQQEQQEADAAAEQAYERHLEDRGYWEARAQDAYEASMGVVPFDVAYAEAMGAS